MTPLAELLGESPAIQAVRATVERLVAHGAEGWRLPPLLIQGETGTGKGLLARVIHRAGPRSSGPLVELNCAAIPETLLEAELFGFERGAFTDARQPKAGLFQTAHRGTLFLDEVGLLPEGVQAKLLKVLEDLAVRRLGSTRSEPADVALLAATSEDLRDLVRARRFREDLYHRLAVVTVRLPPLAERGPDILLLAEHFLARACADYGLAGRRLTPDARAALCAYGWPGNIRELVNVMERVALLTDTSVVTAAVLGLPTRSETETTEPEPGSRPQSFRDTMGTVERAQLLEVLNDTQWNIVRAAARLRIPRGTLRYRIEKLGLQRSGAPPAHAGPPGPRSVPEPTPPPRAGPFRGAPSWERRQLAFLRATLVPPPDGDVGLEHTRALEVLAAKAESFGGRVEGLGPLSVVAAFGLVDYRPEYQHGWGNKPAYTQLRLDPLPPESVQALLNTLLGEDPELLRLKALLVERSEGNPFFLEEIVQTLLETGALVGEQGAHQLARPIDTVEVPATVQAVLAARIDRLSPADKALLQTASVVGKDVPLGLLQAIAELGEDELHAAIGRFQAAEFLYEAGIFPDLEYTFKHALTHDVTYGTLLQERRRALHARIVQTIEALYPDRLAEHVDRLAHHAFRGEVWEKAVAYLRQAGVSAEARSAHRAAVAWFEQALSALHEMPATRETQEQSIDVRIALRVSTWFAGELGKLYPSLREAESLAQTLGDQHRLGWVWTSMSQYFLVSGDSSQARTYAQKAELIGAAFGDVELTAMAHYYLGWACHTAGDLQGAENFIRKAIGDLQGAKDSLRKAVQLLGQEKMVQLVARLSATSRWSLAVSLGERGAFDEAITQAQQGVQLAETVGDAYSLVAGYWGLGHVYSLKGDLRQAGAMLERALALSRGWAFPIQSAYIGAQLGYVYALSARVVEGLALVRQALAALESMGVVAFHSLVVVHLSEVCRLADRKEDARAAAAQALSLARERGERGREADGLRLLGDLLGEVFARRERLDFEAADDHYTQTLTLATQLGMRPLVAHCHLGLGRLAGRKSDSERAHEHLTTAAAMYREMGMDFWLAQAETALRSLGSEAAGVEGRP